MRLTDLVVRNLKAPSKGQVTYTDDSLPGFGVRVSSGGIKAFVLVYGRARKRVTLGRYPAIALLDARKKAKEILAERTLGKVDAPPIKFEQAVKQFLDSHYTSDPLRKRTRTDVELTITRHFMKSMRHEQLADISSHAVASIIDRIQARTQGEAHHAFAALRVFFNWAVRRGYVDHSPCARLKAPPVPPSRDRVLSDKELKSLLLHVRKGTVDHDKIVELLILTGQRKSEIGSLQAEWIDYEKRTITLPANVTKNRRVHTFPFGERVAAILESLPREGVLFPARGLDTPLNSWSKNKALLDEQSGVTGWRLHDLRRTFATNLAALGTAVHVTEKLLNHVSGSLGGIVGIYQRHTYEKEMREAMLLWERKIDSLIAAKPNADDRADTPAIAIAA